MSATEVRMRLEMGFEARREIEELKLAYLLLCLAWLEGSQREPVGVGAKTG